MTSPNTTELNEKTKIMWSENYDKKLVHTFFLNSLSSDTTDANWKNARSASFRVFLTLSLLELNDVSKSMLFSMTLLYGELERTLKMTVSFGPEYNLNFN